MKLYAEQVSELLTTETKLRSQLTADAEKFQLFQVIPLDLYIYIKVVKAIMVQITLTAI